MPPVSAPVDCRDCTLAEAGEDAPVFDRITVEPDKLSGQPCIRGHRFTVAHLVRLIAAEWSLEQIQEEFPFIEADDVHQASLYAAHAAEAATLPLREPA